MMGWLNRLLFKISGGPCKDEPEPRPESPMQFDPADVNAECDICEAPMTSFGHGEWVYGDKALYLSFECGSRWRSKDPEDLYWVEQNYCKQATRMLREARS